MKPRYLNLENFLKEELRKELQDQQFALAEQKIKALHERRLQDASEWPHIFNSNPDYCTHLKGGKFSTLVKDYAVRHHTFPDGHANVKCTICGKEWEPGSQEAKDMMSRTSNTPSSSEVLLLPLMTRKRIEWTPLSITTAVRKASRRLTSRRKSTRKNKT